MDSEHRHELKENDLLEFFRHFKQWWDKHGTKTLGVILLVLGAVVGGRWLAGREARAQEKAWSAFANAQTPETWQQLARTYADREGLAGLSLLAAADEVFQSAMTSAYEQGALDPTRTEPGEATTQRLQRAASLYQQAIDSAGTNGPPLIPLNARLRLGAVHETLGDWAAAESQYEAAWKQAGHYHTVARTAQQRLAAIEHYRHQQLTFAPAPQAAEPNIPASLLRQSLGDDPNEPVLEGPLGPAGELDEPSLLPLPAPAPQSTDRVDPNHLR